MLAQTAGELAFSTVYFKQIRVHHAHYGMFAMFISILRKFEYRKNFEIERR